MQILFVFEEHVQFYATFIFLSRHTCFALVHFMKIQYNFAKDTDSGGIRTHASEETGALNQRLRPLGHAIFHSPETDTI